MSNEIKLVPRPNYPNTFDWKEKGHTVATIMLYPEGLVEFQGKHEVAIEGIGDDEDISIDGLIIR
jgi:hypothetical protein